MRQSFGSPTSTLLGFLELETNFGRNEAKFYFIIQISQNKPIEFLTFGRNAPCYLLENSN